MFHFLKVSLVGLHVDVDNLLVGREYLFLCNERRFQERMWRWVETELVPFENSMIMTVVFSFCFLLLVGYSGIISHSHIVSPLLEKVASFVSKPQVVLIGLQSY